MSENTVKYLADNVHIADQKAQSIARYLTSHNTYWGGGGVVVVVFILRTGKTTSMMSLTL